MIYFVLGFLLLTLLSNNKTTLACGIWGYVGSSMPNMWKFRTLGLYNESRGKHSCGVSVNNQLIHGVYGDKEFSTFIKNVEIPEPEGNSVVLGHTRHATFGSHTVENAHPFLINEQIIGVHNGTIENIRDLAAKYKVDVKGIDVDSKMLYKIIAETGYDVLNDYLGFAALMFTYVNQPNVLYAYHGASQEKADGALWIERPLHYISQPGGIYFSSEDGPLKAIRNTKEFEGVPVEPVSLATNKVYRIDYTNEKPVINVVCNVDREDNNISLAAYKNRHVVTPAARPALPPANPNGNFYGTNSKNTGSGGVGNNSGNSSKRYMTPETLGDYGTYVSYSSGRFSAASKYLHGAFRVTNNGIIRPQVNRMAEDIYLPFFFISGVMIESKEVYDRILLNKKLMKRLSKPKSFARLVSNYSKYPVMVVSGETEDVELMETWYWKGKIHNYLCFSPLMSSLTLEIFNGNNRTLKSTTNREYNKGAVTDYVFTTIEQDDDTGPKAGYELAFLDEVYDDYRDFSLSVSDSQMTFIYGYMVDTYFNGDDDTSEDQVYELLEQMVEGGIASGNDARTSIEMPDRTIDSYYDELLDDVLLEDEDEDDEDEEEDIDDKGLDETIGKLGTIMEQLEAQAAEIVEVPEEQLQNAIEEVIANVVGLKSAGKELEDIDHSDAASLSVMVADFVQTMKEKIGKFLQDRNRTEDYNDMLNKLSDKKVEVEVQEATA